MINDDRLPGSPFHVREVTKKQAQLHNILSVALSDLVIFLWDKLFFVDSHYIYVFAKNCIFLLWVSKLF